MACIAFVREINFQDIPSDGVVRVGCEWFFLGDGGAVGNGATSWTWARLDSDQQMKTKTANAVKAAILADFGVTCDTVVTPTFTQV